LLDAGDFSQGTPYFNFFSGHVEVDALNRMQYVSVTLGITSLIMELIRW
jgi:5'-nucleotidase